MMDYYAIFAWLTGDFEKYGPFKGQDIREQKISDLQSISDGAFVKYSAPYFIELPETDEIKSIEICKGGGPMIMFGKKDGN